MSRVVAITGASAGIGRALALRLARDHASLVLCARRGDRLREVAAAVTAGGGTAVDMVADVSREADMDALVATAVQHFGRLDAVVCNAGFGIYGEIDRISAAQMREMLEVNYMGTFLAARAALGVFRQQQRGHVVLISSIVGRRGVPFTAGYAATKFAQVGLAEGLRAELVGTPIHVSVVFPISTRTEFHDVMVARSGFATRMDGPRQSAETVAEAIVRALDRPRPEIFPYRPSRALGLLNVIAPGLTDRLVKRWGRTPIE